MAENTPSKGEPPWTVEYKSDWVLTEDPPDGWRFCFNQLSDDYERMAGLWTDAPKNESPHKHQTKWIPYERLYWERLVTPWIRKRDNGSSATDR